MDKQLLLISNSKVPGGTYFGHAADEIRSLLGDRKTITFIPYARPGGISHDAYTAALAPTFAKLGYELQCIDRDNAIEDIQRAEALMVGGGNTWKLLKELKDKQLIMPIRERVLNDGMPYIGSSAGSNVAGSSIGNTNDMPAADCYWRVAMQLVEFNVNPHYQDTVTLTSEQREAVLAIAPQLAMLLDHQGETREQRINEYHALENTQTVVALREGSMLRVSGNTVYLRGLTNARIFRPGKEAIECSPGDCLDSLLR
ncbi:dipeptidase PepE [Candidatus Woesearchaeota archaeon]|nr:dipeptidase PepE [Candidatus Woesearchaeota archaeon]